ncbi:MAG TPA: ABC transporter ATP-binding protein [Ignavibacteria bacterium]|nr:ABC transporter ATP-binding protein [Ignavibacteria bacterium]HRA98928.1 ABC transporter ATP-binding protein [Ignavibacteria bacterium]
MNESAIEVKNVTKKFEEVTALDDISFKVKKNKIFGLVGPDGAGKTTMIRIMCGLLRADSGEVDFTDLDLGEGKKKSIIKNEIGYLSQKFSLYTDLTVDENIQFIADIHGVNDFEKRRDELLHFTRLKDFRHFQAGKLSGGMKQKLALACTLIYRPKIIFLDEPTTGVDPVSRREFWVILSGLLKENITILISTPYMDEAERFNYIVMMNNGKVISEGTPAKIKSSLKMAIMEVVCNPVRDAYKILKNIENADIQMFGDRLNIVFKGNPMELEEITLLLKNNNIEIDDIRMKLPSLENVFIELMETDND